MTTVMKSTLLGIALTFSLISCLQAQKAPGYMGRRLFIRPEIAYAPALLGPTANNRGGADYIYGEQGARFGFNAKYGVQAGYAISRSEVLSLEGSYMATGMIMEASTPSILFQNNFDQHYLFYQLSGPEIGLAWNTYNINNGSIAPIGSYVTVRARMAFLSGTILDKRTTYYRNNSSAGHLPLGVIPRYRHLSLGAEVGRQMMIGNRMVLSLSMEVNVEPFNLLRLLLLEDYTFETNQQVFHNAAYARMFRHSLVMFKTGVGYLF